MRNLKHLKRLGLLGTNVTDESLKHLAELSSLTVLNLAYTPVTDAGLAHLHGLVKLEELFLGTLW